MDLATQLELLLDVSEYGTFAKVPYSDTSSSSSS